MAREYKVAKVSQQEPRVWHGPHGDVYYIKTQLEGYEKAVSIGKKKPDSLKAGDTVYGTIEESDLPEDKFKSEQRPQGQQSFPSAPASSNSDTGHSINKSVALKAAVEFAVLTKSISTDGLLDNADKFLGWLENSGATADNKKSQADSNEPKDHQNAADAALDEVHDTFDETEEVNLDDIPF